MSIVTKRRAWIAAGCVAALASIQMAGHVAATTSTSDVEQHELAECFGRYVAGPFASGVIFAEPYPAITWGTGGDDVIVGSDLGDHIYGLGGNDLICAGDGNDYVEGGLLSGGSGVNDVDHIDGGAGSDVLHGGQMRDFIVAGPNFTPAGEYETHDWLYGDDGDDMLFGEGGRDALSGGNDVDFCDGGTGMAGTRPEDDIANGTCDTAVNVP